MAVSSVAPVLLIAVIARCKCEPPNGHNNYNSKNDYHFGDLLKPPPPPQLPILPVPFHGGLGKPQHQSDQGYQYQSPPSAPSTLPLSPSADFKFPAPFYKQYNFNFVPLPQPFTTTQSPTIFQKVSGWLFPSQQTSAELGNLNNDYSPTYPLKKDCNPCNLMPWIPVIRYDLASGNGRHNINPTYRPPKLETASHYNPPQNSPQPFNGNNNSNQQVQITSGVPHAIYGLPSTSYASSSSSFTSPIPTYGPPSPTHTVTISNHESLSSPYSVSSSSIHSPPKISIQSVPSNTLSSFSYNELESKYRLFPTTYATPTSAHESHFSPTTRSPVVPSYKPELLNQYLPTQNTIELFNELEPSSELELPKVAHPTGFRNSYGEPILNPYASNVPYSITAAGAASTKIKTSVLPDKFQVPNMSLALANPAPFSLSRGRNIHTLQPVALPNLSVSPLPPIFNARPFRTVSSNYPLSTVLNINKIQHETSDVNVAKSIPIAEYTHSVEYPTTIIQSPVIDIDKLEKKNKTKVFQNFQNSYVIDDIKDISPQASEDHISAANSNHDSSFESVGNDLYDSSIPLDFNRYPNAPFNHKVSFADLRGVKDEDVDKYRTESNLQYIDSPLLYLKPSAPHKNYQHFFSETSTSGKPQEYEIYDELPSTTASPQSTIVSEWDENKTYLTEKLSAPTEEENNNSTRRKIVQIIVPYTSNQNSYIHDNKFSLKDLYSEAQEFQARKIQSNTENFVSVTTEGYTGVNITTDEPKLTITDNYASEILNTPESTSDIYDIKEPPFDIIKLQHTIDDWTEQEYSKHYGTSQRTRSSEKYSKQIPDDFFTTNSPIVNYPTETNNYNFNLFDHEGSSSIQHAITENRSDYVATKRKEYNTIERTKNTYETNKNEDLENIKKLHIYTAASAFRSTTTTTAAPWGQIQTSISPLTNEKVYVVTSKPWQEKNLTTFESGVDKFVSKKTEIDTDSTTRDNFPFKSPRFFNRPSFGFTAGLLESIEVDSPYGFSKGWYRRINNLEYPSSDQDSTFEEDSDKDLTITKKEDENA